MSSASATSTPLGMSARCRPLVGSRLLFARLVVVHVGLVASLGVLVGCSQNLTVVDAVQQSTGGNSGSCPATCNPSDASQPLCCANMKCQWGKCAATDAGVSQLGDAGSIGFLGDSCASDNVTCGGGSYCATIDNDKVICASAYFSTNTGVCNLPTDCGSLNCDSTKHCGTGPSCKVTGSYCAADSDCCTNKCDNNVCNNDRICQVIGDTCDNVSWCCSGSCQKIGSAPTAPSRCVALSCRNPPDICSTSRQCCSENCLNFQCISSPPACTQVNSPCSNGSTNSCCSGICNSSSLCEPLDGCQPKGDWCEADEDCCSGTCDKPNSRCSSSINCLDEGEPCSSLLGCCGTMSSCIYDQEAGLNRCSEVPASSIAVGQQCAFDAQCATTGNGSVKCEKDTSVKKFYCTAKN